MLRNILKHFSALVLSVSLIWTPQLTLATTISLQSGLSHLDMDLGAAHLRIEQIDSSIRLATDLTGVLKVAHVKAKRIIVTMKEHAKQATDSANLLPSKINLPLPIIVQDALVDEIIIKSGTSTTTLKHVALSLEANNKNLKIALSNVTILAEQKSRGLVEKYDAKLQLNMVNQKPFNLDGFIEVVQAPKAEEKNSTKTVAKDSIRVDLSGSLQHLHFANQTVLIKQDNQISIRPEAGNTNAFAHITTEGEISLEGNYPVSIHTTVQNLNPEMMNNALAGNINLNVDVTGQLSPVATFKVSTQSNDSTLSGLPLKLDSTFSIENSQLKTLNLTASLAKNQLQASGELGAANSILSWQAHLNDLSNFGAEFAGSVNANGKITGAADALSLQYQLAAEKLRFPDLIKIEKIDANGTLSTASNGVMQSDIKVVSINKNDSMPINAVLTLQGTQQKHSLALNVKNTNPADKSLGLEAFISGGFDYIAKGAEPKTSHWQGQIEKIGSSHNQSIQLAHAAPMQWSDENGFVLQNFALNIDQGKLLIDSLQLNKLQANSVSTTRFTTKGRIDHLALANLPDNLLTLPDNMAQNLVVSGDWNINMAEKIDADIKLWRESGDISLIKLDDKTLNLGLETMRANVSIQQNAIKADAHILGVNFGALNAEASTILSSNLQGSNTPTFGLASSAPLKLNVVGQLNTLTWVPFPEAIQDAQSDGQLQLTMSADGTIDEPNLKGSITGSNLAFQLPSQGVQLKNGALKAEFTDKTLNINQLVFTGGAGTMQAIGKAELKQGKPFFNLDWQADKFTALSRTDRFLVLTGSANTQLNNNLLTINGDFKVLNGLFELPKNTAPTLGDDVIIVSGNQSQAESAKKKVNENALKINIAALHIDFGASPTTNSLDNAGTNIAAVFDPSKQFIIRGNGLEGVVSGAVNLSGKPDKTINAKGSLEVGGTYLAYGQILNIETGTINFSGPIENAGLNILATRNTSPVKAGVQITGSVRTPTVKLVSTPEVPDSDKLSWLILGQPLEKAGQSGLAVLSLAASSILGNGNSVPLQTRLARSAGFDSLSVNGSDASSYSVSVGKRLSPNLYLGYEKSLFGLLNIAKLTYDITKRVSVVTRAGSDSAVDLLYTFSFN